ncbi:MAG: SMC-Scp complex subunit ScpB [Desulfosarcina sp.]
MNPWIREPFFLKPMAEDLKSIIESLLFVSETPLTLEHLKGVVAEADNAAIRAAIDELATEYSRRDGGFVLKQVAGGYQFRTQGRYNEWVKRLVRPSAPRLSKAALETLAIIAYNQPVIRSDIEHIRGVDSGGVLRLLMERKLIRVLGRKEIPGRPLVYATTSHFLEVFELRDLKDLPTPIEIEALSRLRPDSASDTRDCPSSAGQPANPPEPGGEPGDAGDLE